MAGELFYHGVCPSVINTMGWKELIYWSGWVDTENKEKRRSLKELENP